MSSERLQASSIKNKIKREEVARKQRKTKRQEKLQKRLARAKIEATDPKAKQKRISENVPRTLENTREYDPSFLTAQQPEAGPSRTDANNEETNLDIETDPFAEYFDNATQIDASISPKVLITTSFQSSKPTLDFCNELVNVVPGAEFIRRKKGRKFDLGNVSGWASSREYTNLIVVNEDMKKPNAITIIHLPNGPMAYYKLSSVQPSKQISGHARPSDHFPELVLNNFSTRLGHMVGRLFQTIFPPMPEFEGRQVVTFHNQRDFIFFRRHRYAFRSTEKAALQEIGPRFTLKLRWIKKGTPSVPSLGSPSKPLSLLESTEEPESEERQGTEEKHESEEKQGGDLQESSIPQKNEYIWLWKPELETTRRTFFL